MKIDEYRRLRRDLELRMQGDFATLDPKMGRRILAELDDMEDGSALAIERRDHLCRNPLACHRGSCPLDPACDE